MTHGTNKNRGFLKVTRTKFYISDQNGIKTCIYYMPGAYLKSVVFKAIASGSVNIKSNYFSSDFKIIFYVFFQLPFYL